MFKLLVSLFFFLCLTSAAQAQRFDSYQLSQRLTQIEQQLMYLQQQSTAQPGIANSGQYGAEIGRIDEDIRVLRGQIEQTQYQIDQLQKQITAMQEDFEFRFQQMNKSGTAKSQPLPEEQTDSELTSDLRAIVGSENASQSLEQSAEGLDDPRSLYNHAFKLLNQTNYDAAESSFQQFTKKYPEDPLVGNAWYWLGESHYVRRNYVKAADSFRQGYEVLPDGPKAGDNLLKLAMALTALQRNDEACVVLHQVDQKYSGNSDALREKSRQEISRLNCK